MELIPTQEEVVALLRRTGGLRDGHFEYPNGVHSSECLQVPLTMRYFEDAKILSVALSRKLRAHNDLRVLIPQLSVVAPATGGLPVAYGVCEALRAHQVYWAERDNADERLHFRQFLEVKPGEKVLLVDDIFRTGSKLTEIKALVEGQGGEVAALAVVVYQPHPSARSIGALPFFYLAKLDAVYADNAGSCEMCKRGVPLTKVRV
jgi:orotate phosphoribosyltransferase